MDRDRWSAFPAESEEDLRLLALLAEEGRPTTRDVLVTGPHATRTLGLRQSVVVEEPFGGKADVVSRVEIVGGPLRDDETVAEDLWQAALDFLAAAEERARLRLSPTGP